MRPSLRPFLAALALPLAVTLAACDVATSPPPPSPGMETPAVESPLPEVSPDGSPDAFPSPTVDWSSPDTSPEAAVIEVVGVEYRFEGVPSTMDAGTELRLRNDGQEVHEIVLVRRNQGVTESWQDLLALPEQDVMQLVTIEGVVMANPGDTTEETVVASEPGDYLLICFIPTGMRELPPTDDPNATFPPGPPHFTLGMMQEITVR
jgi:hypothetical protein